MQVSTSGTCRTSGSCSARMMLDVTYMGNTTDHIWCRLRGESGSLHSGQLPGGPVRADRRRAVLEYDDGEPAGALAADAAQPDRRPVLTRPTTSGSSTIDARGWYQGVRFGLTEAPRRRLEHQRQLHLQQVHQRRRARGAGDIGNAYPVPMSPTSRAAIRIRTRRPTKGRAPPIAATTSTCLPCSSAPGSAAASSRRSPRLADRPHLAGAQRQPDHADDDGRLRR